MVNYSIRNICSLAWLLLKIMLLLLFEHQKNIQILTNVLYLQKLLFLRFLIITGARLNFPSQIHIFQFLFHSFPSLFQFGLLTYCFQWCRMQELFTFLSFYSITTTVYFWQTMLETKPLLAKCTILKY